jgi:hypothetical protein
MLRLHRHVLDKSAGGSEYIRVQFLKFAYRIDDFFSSKNRKMNIKNRGSYRQILKIVFVHFARQNCQERVNVCKRNLCQKKNAVSEIPNTIAAQRSSLCAPMRQTAVLVL